MGGLTQVLRSMKDPAGNGLLKKTDNVRFIGTLYILRELLPELSTLSKTFQTGSFNFSRVAEALRKLKET